MQFTFSKFYMNVRQSCMKHDYRANSIFYCTLLLKNNNSTKRIIVNIYDR